jgi:hypothetical protein
MAPSSRRAIELTTAAVNDDITTALKIVAGLGGAAVAIWLGIILVKAARRGGGGMQALGAAMMMFGWGTMRDLSSNPVAEAKDGRAEKGTPSGDPLDRPPPEIH